MSIQVLDMSPIKPSNFYGNHEKMKKTIIEVEQMSKRQASMQPERRKMPRHLMGPTQFWSAFYKQADAIEAAYENSTNDDPLCTFVYQQMDGRRIFVVAHPEVYWWSFIHNLTPERRCAYEVIPEGAPCCLYLDLEYDIVLNPNKNGIQMTQTMIEILCGYISKYWAIKCDEKNAINLDSTTTKKFSRHVIFRLKDLAFKDNSHIGRFIKNIVADIEEYLTTNGSAFHSVLSYVDRKNLEELFIVTDKKKKIFVDTAVYTKNRHFRIYKATKWEKFSHLELAPDCRYKLIKEYKDKEKGIFLESLISYFLDKSDMVFLEFNKEYPSDNHTTRGSQICRSLDQVKIIPSPYPAIDKYILMLAHPGVIRQSKYFQKSNTIVYDIVGNRYCANIERQHKSNGIYWVVDLITKSVYQKCHDEDDCPGFRSVPTPLPLEISFLLDDQDDEIFFNVSDNPNEFSNSIDKKKDL